MVIYNYEQTQFFEKDPFKSLHCLSRENISPAVSSKFNKGSSFSQTVFITQTLG